MRNISEETLLRYTDPAYYGDLKNELVEEADQLDKNPYQFDFLSGRYFR